MSIDIVIAFAVFQLTFWILDGYILSLTGRDIGKQEEYIWFGVLVVTHMIYLVVNTLWSMQEYDLLHLPRPILMAICTVSLWTVANSASAFFLFVVERMKLNPFRSGVGRILKFVPAALTTVLIFTSPWTGLAFRLSEDDYFVHGPLYMVVVVASSLYLATVAVVAGVNTVRARTTFKRRSNGAVLASVLLLILYIVVDGSLGKASILPAAIFAVIVIIFLTLQETNINSDPLTGMNNRHKADDYLTEKLNGISPQAPMYLYMCDMNKFKGINDTYGHAEGDEALILASRALKMTIARYNGFAARFGGDEFLLAWEPHRVEDPDPDKLEGIVNDLLRELAAQKPYPLSMTLGYTLCQNPKETLNTCIKRADAMLYQRKAALRTGR